MATISHAITTKDRIKERLNIPNTNFDALIEHLIANVTDFIEGQCNRRFKKATYTNEIYDGEGKKYLALKAFPIISVSSLQYNGGAIISPVWINYLADEYQILDKEGMIYIPGKMVHGLRNIRVSYEAGYLIDFSNENDTTKHNLPFDISGLAERLVVREFKRREDVGKSGETVGDATVNFYEDLETQDKTVIEKYKRIVFA